LRIPPTWSFGQAPAQVTKDWLGRMLGEIGSLWQYCQQAMNGNLTFGDKYDTDNIKGGWFSFTSHAVADTEFALVHNLGQVPIGVLDFCLKDKAGVLYQGPTPWTTSTIYLRCNVASTAFRVFVVLGPEEY
jgi:hypothetical protein